MATTTDVIGSIAEDERDRAVVASLWDKTFSSYAPETIVKMPYYFNAEISCATNTTSILNQFKANSIYDFDLTGSGHQPLGRDTWAGIYNYYKVLETRLHVRVTTQTYDVQTVPGGTNAYVQCPVFIGGLLDISATPPASLVQWQEASKTGANNKQMRFSPIHMITSVGSRNDNKCSFDMTWIPEDFEQAIIEGYSNTQWVPIGSDPGVLNYFSIMYSNINNGAKDVLVECNAEFLVAFKQVNRSLLYTTN
nr:MAG: capsid protein [Cressdnaviricota sp.]